MSKPQAAWVDGICKTCGQYTHSCKCEHPSSPLLDAFFAPPSNVTRTPLSAKALAADANDPGGPHPGFAFAPSTTPRITERVRQAIKSVSDKVMNASLVEADLYELARIAAESALSATPRSEPDHYQRNPKAGPCKCGLKEVPAGCDGVQWYWQRHARLACTLELPNIKCWCGRLRSEHTDGHDESQRNLLNAADGGKAS